MATATPSALLQLCAGGRTGAYALVSIAVRARVTPGCDICTHILAHLGAHVGAALARKEQRDEHGHRDDDRLVDDEALHGR